VDDGELPVRVGSRQDRTIVSHKLKIVLSF
jgi:hypothetical protein